MTFGRNVVARTFAALRHRNYRLYFAGQAGSLIGTWMQIVAAGWLVLRITQSPLLLGVIGAMESLPSLFFSPFAGALADRFDRRRIAVLTQALAGLQAMALGLLVATDHATFWSVFWLALFAGVVNAFDLPVRQSLMFDLVGPDDILNATALNSLVFNAARIVGPAIAAIIIARAGEALNFFANAASYVFVVIALLGIRTAKQERRSTARPMLREVADGVSYVWRHPLLARMFALIVVYSIFGFNYVVLMPVFARFTLHRGAAELGLLLSSIGVGALVGALTVAGREKGHLRSLAIMAFVYPASLIAFGLTASPDAALVGAAVVGFSLIHLVVRHNVFLQTETTDDMRGRVLGLYNTVLVGLAPAGALQAGAIAQAFGAGPALSAGGVVCMLAAVVVVTLPGRKPAPSLVEVD